MKFFDGARVVTKIGFAADKNDGKARAEMVDFRVPLPNMVSYGAAFLWLVMGIANLLLYVV